MYLGVIKFTYVKISHNCITVTLLIINSKNQYKKTSHFTTQCESNISHAFKTAKITVFDPMMCKSPDVPLQDELLCGSFVAGLYVIGLCAQLELIFPTMQVLKGDWLKLAARHVRAHLQARLHANLRDIFGRAHLRSAERRDMLVPRTRTELGRRSFSVAAPTVWNSLPAHLRSTLISRR